MERENASTFKGPRAYFTDFDHRIASRVEDQEGLIREAERKLKILLLTKSTVVCAASHLSSPVAYRLLRSHPELLTEAHILPALRNDKMSIAEAIEGKTPESVPFDEASSFYDDHVARVVAWEKEDNSAWFRNSFLAQLQDDRSVLRASIRDSDPAVVASLIARVAEKPLLGRTTIADAAAQLGTDSGRSLLAFRELLYHLSGARVVNCESALPQENYIDYSLTDLETRRTTLSDAQVFWKLFVETAFESLHKTRFPIEVLDLLTFADIAALRTAFEERAFAENYDALVRVSLTTLPREDPDALLYSAEEVLELRERLESVFSEVLDDELTRVLARRKWKKSGSAVQKTVSFGAAIAGVFSTAASVGGAIISTLTDVPVLISNVSDLLRGAGSTDQRQQYLRAKERMVRRAAESAKIKKNTVLVDGMRLMNDAIKMRLDIP